MTGSRLSLELPEALKEALKEGNGTVDLGKFLLAEPAGFESSYSAFGKQLMLRGAAEPEDYQPKLDQLAYEYLLAKFKQLELQNRELLSENRALIEEAKLRQAAAVDHQGASQLSTNVERKEQVVEEDGKVDDSEREAVQESEAIATTPRSAAIASVTMPATLTTTSSSELQRLLSCEFQRLMDSDQEPWSKFYFQWVQMYTMSYARDLFTFDSVSRHAFKMQAGHGLKGFLSCQVSKDSLFLYRQGLGSTKMLQIVQ